MRDRALIVTEFPAKSFILNRIAEEDERSRGPESRRDLERAGKGWEGVRATGSSINSREMQASLADSPLVFSSAFERSFDGLTGPFLTWFPGSCIRVFPLSPTRRRRNSLWTRNRKRIFDTRIQRLDHIPKYFQPRFTLCFGISRMMHTPVYIIFLLKERVGEKEEASFDDVLLIVSSNNARIAGIYGKYRPIYLFFCFPPLFVSVNIKSCYRALWKIAVDGKRSVRQISINIIVYKWYCKYVKILLL